MHESGPFPSGVLDELPSLQSCETSWSRYPAEPCLNSWSTDTEVIPMCCFKLLSFPYFLQFKSEFGNKFMIWATVTPGLVFADCIELLHLWLQEYNQSDFRINHLVMSMCKVVSHVLEEGVCYDQCILLVKLLAFALLHFVLQGQICLLLQVIWLPTFAF